MKTPISLILTVFILALTGAGCSGKTTQLSGSTGAITAPPTVTQVLAATPAQCPNGGADVIVFQDVNGTGAYSTGDTIESQEPICDGAAGATGATGAQGVGAGVAVSAAPAGACPAGGTQIMTFIDPTNTGVYQTGDTVTSTSTICNGVNGTDGTDGTSASITVTNASVTQCPSGGAVYTSITTGENPQSTVICDGTNGTNGTNAVFETGPVGAPVPNEPYTACHHDYLYIPDQTNPSSGWLLFRHQENGTADQGPGTTGFDVWDADITSFELASEVGDVVYCTLTWDPGTLVLTYTVVDTQDGLAGETGTIQM